MAASNISLMMLLSLAIPASFAASLNQTTGDANSCDQIVQTMDAIFKESLFIKQDAKFPSTNEEIESYCKNGKLFAKAAKDFNKCSKPFPRQVVSILGKSLQRTLKSMCKPGKPRQKLIDAFQCVTTSYHSDLQGCGLVLVNQIHISSQNMSSGQLFPLICCSFHSLVDCIRGAPMPTCKDEQFNITNFLMVQIDKLIKEFIDLLCGKWSTVQECQSAAPEVFEHLKKLSDVGQFNKDESLLGTILNIVSKLSDEEV